LPDGRKLVTLKDAADYVTKLPKKESELPEWQTAIEALMLCSRSSDPMLARIGSSRRSIVKWSGGLIPIEKRSHCGSSRGTGCNLDHNLEPARDDRLELMVQINSKQRD